MSKALILSTTVIGGALLLASSQRSPSGIGRAATAEEIRARDIDIAPTGAGLPEGSGTARAGRSIYLAKCARCHGVSGQGIDGYPRLVGGPGTLASNNPVLTVGSYWPYATTLWDYVRRAMPYSAPNSLTPDEVYSVTAYILYLNHITREGDELDSHSVPAVEMPNRDGFIVDSTDFNERQ